MMSRASAALLLLLLALTACGGPNSRLITVRSGGSSPGVDFTVKNATSVPINALYLAKTEQVAAAGENLDYESAQGVQLWGADLLARSGIASGDRLKLEVPEPGTWDVRALDRDSRYQHVTALRLHAGGRYILELNDGGWRVK